MLPGELGGKKVKVRNSLDHQKGSDGRMRDDNRHEKGNGNIR